ncbi:hypothetical protein LWF15_33470 [Kineosporia rhizophila]|uniref:hypothetical protein n=1 Tax=Kineosporia rhizophila TaxID=84633 RepID=UPI000A56AD39|nr:hypothetical protein [Kineosporia rhizophila]MCE0540415.1 hypothetical protein [Kineosporia rhizophila]
MPHTYKVEYHHNVSATTDGNLAIRNRHNSELIQPGDSFEYVCTLTFNADSLDHACALALAAGTHREYAVGSAEYDYYTDRRFGLGDLLYVHISEGESVLRHNDRTGSWFTIRDASSLYIIPGGPKPQLRS